MTPDVSTLPGPMTTGEELPTQATSRHPRGRVLLVVCLYEDNFGDKLIYSTVDRKLRNAGFETEPVEINQRLSESRLIERANSSDFLFFVGGGLIERYAPDLIRMFDRLHQRLRVPYGVVGLSTGSFDYSEFRDSLRLFCDRASFFYTRDEESVESFRKAGASKLPTVGVDMVFANDTISKLRRVGDGIAASFRNVPYADVTGDLDWTEWAGALRKVGVASLIPDCHDAQLQMGLPVNPDPVLRQLSEAGTVIAMRYHVVLTAAMLGVIPIPIAYCPKVGRLAEQLGIEEYCLCIHDYDKLEATLARLRSNEQTVKNRLTQKVLEMERRANDVISDSIETMECAINGR